MVSQKAAPLFIWLDQAHLDPFFLEDAAQIELALDQIEREKAYAQSCYWVEENIVPEFRTAVLYGFRTGTPRLVLLNRKWNWALVLEKVQALLPNFIRNKPEIDKEALISQRAELAEFLPMVGVKVTQAEAFFVEPKLENLENATTREAA